MTCPYIILDLILSEILDISKFPYKKIIFAQSDTTFQQTQSMEILMEKTAS